MQERTERPKCLVDYSQQLTALDWIILTVAILVALLTISVAVLMNRDRGNSGQTECNISLKARRTRGSNSKRTAADLFPPVRFDVSEAAAVVTESMSARCGSTSISTLCDNGGIITKSESPTRNPGAQT
jgi:hypothetical protein